MLVIVSVTIPLFGGCDNPMRPRVAPDERALSLFMILDPDLTMHPVMVRETSSPGISDLRGSIDEGGVRVTEAAVSPSSTPTQEDYSRETDQCRYRYGVTDPERTRPRCVVFPFQPRFGATYDVVVTSRDRPTARATTTIPGDFAILSHSVEGELPSAEHEPPGTISLRVDWSRSSSTYRYVVTVRGADVGMPTCTANVTCPMRWYAVTEDTSLTARIPAQRFEQSAGPYYVEVYAMNRDIFGYLMTGTVSDFFPVPPAQNVRDGYGSVGAWVKRSVPLL